MEAPAMMSRVRLSSMRDASSLRARRLLRRGRSRAPRWVGRSRARAGRPASWWSWLLREGARVGRAGGEHRRGGARQPVAEERLGDQGDQGEGADAGGERRCGQVGGGAGAVISPVGPGVAGAGCGRGLGSATGAGAAVGAAAGASNPEPIAGDSNGGATNPAVVVSETWARPTSMALRCVARRKTIRSAGPGAPGIGLSSDGSWRGAGRGPGRCAPRPPARCAGRCCPSSPRSRRPARSDPAGSP
jgi:hypothetical protein